MKEIQSIVTEAVNADYCCCYRDSQDVAFPLLNSVIWRCFVWELLVIVTVEITTLLHSAVTVLAKNEHSLNICNRDRNSTKTARLVNFSADTETETRFRSVFYRGFGIVLQCVALLYNNAHVNSLVNSVLIAILFLFCFSVRIFWCLYRLFHIEPFSHKRATINRRRLCLSGLIPA